MANGCLMTEKKKDSYKTVNIQGESVGQKFSVNYHPHHLCTNQSTKSLNKINAVSR